VSGQTDGRTDGRTDRRSLILYPPFFFEKVGQLHENAGSVTHPNIRLSDTQFSTRIHKNVAVISFCFQGWESKLHRILQNVKIIIF
jgi:hypothetical protein